MSQFMLEMFTFLFNISLESRAPLSDGIINDQLVQLVPRFNNALMQLADISNFLLIYSLLHYTPDFIVNWIKVRTAWLGGHRVSEMKSGVSAASSSIVSRAL